MKMTLTQAHAAWLTARAEVRRRQKEQEVAEDVLADAKQEWSKAATAMDDAKRRLDETIEEG